MRWQPTRFGSQAGFTLIEMITVIVLMGMLCIYVAPRVFDGTVFKASGFHNETLSLLRYAQKTAIAQRRVVCLAFTPSSATLHISALPGVLACETPLSGPTGQLPGTLTVAGDTAYSTFPTGLNFNALGQPVDASGFAITTQTLQVKGVNRTITVEAVTGYVHD